MALFKNVDGTRIQLSPQEELEVGNRESEWLAGADVRAAEEVREKRNIMLSASDWMAVTDRTMTGPETAYRQSLRQVPQQETFPSEVTWPVAP
tara:strand:+ start:1261 stop:1539 length:279 start_codon:yes stop_codon:yes gene_type:complete